MVLYGRGGIFGSFFFSQPTAQRSETFLACVVFVVLNALHGQDRTAEAQTSQRMHHERRVGRAAERRLDATIAVLCVLVLVCVSQNAPPALGWQGSRTVLGCY